MTQLTAQRFPVTIGLDVGDRFTHFCVLGPEKNVEGRGKFATTQGELRSALKQWRGAPRPATPAGWHERGTEGFEGASVFPRINRPRYMLGTGAILP